MVRQGHAGDLFDFSDPVQKGMAVQVQRPRREALVVIALYIGDQGMLQIHAGPGLGALELFHHFFRRRIDHGIAGKLDDEPVKL